MKLATILAVILLAPPAVALAQQPQSEAMKAMDMQLATNPATRGYMHSMQAMQDKMKGMAPTNDPNKDFVSMMKPHHQAAVEIAETYLKYGTDPTLKKMAKEIVSSQKMEITELDAWQAKHTK